jgi:hypothetical protein
MNTTETHKVPPAFFPLASGAEAVATYDPAPYAWSVRNTYHLSFKGRPTPAELRYVEEQADEIWVRSYHAERQRRLMAGLLPPPANAKGKATDGAERTPQKNNGADALVPPSGPMEIDYSVSSVTCLGCQTTFVPNMTLFPVGSKFGFQGEVYCPCCSASDHRGPPPESGVYLLGEFSNGVEDDDDPTS